MKALKGTRILSLALNLPGPAALSRLHAMGANCLKIEPPGGDLMVNYSRTAYAAMHSGVKLLELNLKTEAGQAALHKQLKRADVLLTSFRPSALHKLALRWTELHKRYPKLSMVSIFGATGAAAELPGHDLTYLAQNGLVQGTDLPATLYSDMSSALLVTEAVLKSQLQQVKKGKGSRFEVAISEAAHWLAMPRAWGLTQPEAVLGGGHAGYRVYACLDGRVAVAALEPHFARALCMAAGMSATNFQSMMNPATHELLSGFFSQLSCVQLELLAVERDIPLHTLPN
jgi:alpha-methylacyl-CoA racemase